MAVDVDRARTRAGAVLAVVRAVAVARVVVVVVAVHHRPGMDCFKLNCKVQHILMILCS